MRGRTLLMKIVAFGRFRNTTNFPDIIRNILLTYKKELSKKIY